jgi:hypothetical protein
MRDLLFALAIVLVVVGAGLSYSGYNKSLRVSTQSFTITSTQTITSTETHEYTSTETYLSTTTGSESILDETFNLQSWGAYFCHSQYYNVAIDAGKVHVSYSSSAGAVDFWLLDEKGFADYNSTKYCEDLHKVGSIFQQFGSSIYEADVTIPSSGTYYVVFLNRSVNDSTIKVKMDYSVPKQTVVTETEEHTYTYYSTEQSPLVTETVTFSTQSSFSTQLGPPFYWGIALIVVAGILGGIILAGSRRKRAEPSPTHVPQTTPVSPPTLPTQPSYVEYLAKLEELKTRGHISEETYLKLKKEFMEKLEQGTG